MVFGLFKSGDQLFIDGIEYIKRKEYSKARDAFEKSIDKDSTNEDTARIMLAILNVERAMNASSSYSAIVRILESKVGVQVEFGLTTVDCAKLSVQCSVSVDEMNALSMSTTNADVLKKRAESCFSTAMRYQSEVGADTLIIPELFGSAKVTGIQRALVLMAEGNESMAESVAFSDPKKAAEYYQIALSYRMQTGDSNAEARIHEKIRMYSKAVCCWICGREATGQMIHFLAMPSEDMAVHRDNQKSPLPSSDGGSIYVCRSCYSAISNRADAISRGYYNSAIQEMRTMEARLNSKIDAMYNMSMRR